MKRIFKSGLSVMLALTLLLSMAACASTPQDDTGAPSSSVPVPEYFLPPEDGYNQVTFYWKHSSGIENCDIWIWWAGKDGTGNVFYPCEYGGKVVVNVPKILARSVLSFAGTAPIPAAAVGAMPPRTMRAIALPSSPERKRSFT